MKKELKFPLATIEDILDGKATDVYYIRTYKILKEKINLIQTLPWMYMHTISLKIIIGL
jgi:hypothetical protein